MNEKPVNQGIYPHFNPIMRIKLEDRFLTNVGSFLFILEHAWVIPDKEDNFRLDEVDIIEDIFKKIDKYPPLTGLIILDTRDKNQNWLNENLVQNVQDNNFIFGLAPVIVERIYRSFGIFFMI